MKLTKTAYCLIYRARRDGIRIKTRDRTIFIAHTVEAVSRMCDRLCLEFWFAIQREIV